MKAIGGCQLPESRRLCRRSAPDDIVVGSRRGTNVPRSLRFRHRVAFHSGFCFVLYNVTFSPPSGVPNAPQTPNRLGPDSTWYEVVSPKLMVSVMKRTEPSKKTTFTPPVWKLLAVLMPQPVSPVLLRQVGALGGSIVWKPWYKLKPNAIRIPRVRFILSGSAGSSPICQKVSSSRKFLPSADLAVKQCRAFPALRISDMLVMATPPLTARLRATVGLANSPIAIVLLVPSCALFIFLGRCGLNMLRPETLFAPFAWR